MHFTEQDLIQHADKKVTEALETAKKCVTLLTDFLDPHIKANAAIQDDVAEVFDFERCFIAQVKAVADESTDSINSLEDAVQKLDSVRFLCVESGMRISSKLLDVIQNYKLNFPDARKIQFMIKQVFDNETLSLGNA